MLKNKLAKIRKTQKVFETSHTLLTFIPDKNIDDETLYDLLTIHTDYSSRQYKNFDRYALTLLKEQKFNNKFSKFLCDCLTLKPHDGFNYLMEFLIRRFNIDTFNRNELFFVILPFKEYKEQISYLCRDISYMKDFVDYDYAFLARAILKSGSFFDLFLDYFNYYNTVENFIKEIINEMINNSFNEKMLNRMFILCEKLSKFNFTLFIKTYELLNSKYDLGEEFKDLEAIINDYNNSIKGDSGKIYLGNINNEITKNVLGNKSIPGDLIHTPINNCKLINVLTPLSGDSLEIRKRLKINNTALTTTELDIINNWHDLKGVIKIIEKLEDRRPLLIKIIESCDINMYIDIINVDELDLLCDIVDLDNIKMLTDRFGSLIFNHLNESFIRDNITKILAIVLEMKNPDLLFLENILTIEMLNKYRFKSEISIINLLNLFTTRFVIDLLSPEKDGCIAFLHKHKIYAINSLYYIVNKATSDREILKIYAHVVKCKNTPLNLLMLTRCQTMQLSAALLKKLISNFNADFIYKDKLRDLLINNFYKHAFIKKLAASFVNDGPQLENHILIKNLMEDDESFTHDFFKSADCQFLAKMLTVISLDRLIMNSHAVFVDKYALIKKAILINTKEYAVHDNFNKFTGYVLQNKDSQALDLYLENKTLFLTLFQYDNDDRAVTLINRGVHVYSEYTCEIHEMISKDVNLFFTVYFDAYKSLGMINDYDMILSKLPQAEHSQKLNENVNNYIMGLIENKNSIIKYLKSVIPFCDEISIVKLIEVYNNMMIPYITSILDIFQNNIMVRSALVSNLPGIMIISYTLTIDLTPSLIMLLNECLKTNPEKPNLILRCFLSNKNKIINQVSLIANIIIYYANNYDKSLYNLIKTELIENHHINNKDTLYKLFEISLASTPLYFDDYIEVCLDNILLGKYDCLLHVSLFFKRFKDLKFKDKVKDTCNKLFKLIHDTCLVIDCLSSLLNYIQNEELLVSYNKTILTEIKNSRNVKLNYKALKQLYKGVVGFKNVIAMSVPYFSLFLDGEPVVRNGCKDLLNYIQEVTKENPYEYFDD